MAPQDVISELRRNYDELTQSQKRIAEAIVEDPEFVAFATVDKFAARLSVSPSTVVRFAYRIGLNGYQELQEKVRERVRLQMRSSTAAGDGRPRHDHASRRHHLRPLVRPRPGEPPPDDPGDRDRGPRTVPSTR